ncbi:MAG: glycoside hydrolase family 16 protein [Kiritimatiellia bacterium]
MVFGPDWAYGQQDYMIHDVKRTGRKLNAAGDAYASGEHCGRLECNGANIFVRETVEAVADDGAPAMKVRYQLESQDGGPMKLERAVLQMAVGAGEFADGVAVVDGKEVALGSAYSGADALVPETEARSARLVAKDGTTLKVKAPDGARLRCSVVDGRKANERIVLELPFADVREGTSAAVDFIVSGMVAESGKAGGVDLGLPLPPGVGPQVIKPKAGVIVPRTAATDTSVDCFEGATAAFTDQGTIEVALPRAQVSAIRVKPNGWYNLNLYMRLEATVRNTGAAPFRPYLRLESGHDTDAVTREEPVAAGQTGTVALDFFKDGLQWQASGDTDVQYTPGLGQPLNTHRTTGIVLCSADDGAEFELVSLVAKKVTQTPPEWSGKRPPVPGEWKMTLDENFNGEELDRNVWDYGEQEQFWGPLAHFHDDQLQVRDGKLHIVFEKRRGHENGKPDGKVTDYATGFCQTYGKFTQAYGYFEARMKLPSAPGIWPAFWMMPDRGPSKDEHGNDTPWWARIDTKFGGMEFDVVEQLSTWGPYRYNIAFHWDGYGEEHRTIGTSNIYILPDEEGFFTAGLLWEPGRAVYYANGKPVAEWTSERISSVPAHMIFYMVDGGWANEPIDDAQLPDEFVVDWVRVWQLEERLAK